MGSLDNQVAIITGSGSKRGIGRDIAKTFASEGAIVIIADKNEEGALETANDLLNEGFAKVEPFMVDVTNEKSVHDMVDRTINKFGHVDILVNCAGISRKAAFEEISVEEWERFLKVNLTSMFLCCQAVLSHLKDQQYGRIINLSSVSALQGGGNFVGAHYAVTKAGIIGLTKVLAREYAAYGITVNAIAPSLVDTDIVSDLLTDEKRKMMEELIPVGRIANPGDVSNAALFLALLKSSYITGVTINVNGGYYIA